jgi:hypothetical protein
MVWYGMVWKDVCVYMRACTHACAEWGLMKVNLLMMHACMHGVRKRYDRMIGCLFEFTLDIIRVCRDESVAIFIFIFISWTGNMEVLL